MRRQKRTRATLRFDGVTVAAADLLREDGADQSSDDVETAARMARSAASDAPAYASDRSVQLHGGIGFTWENRHRQGQLHDPRGRGDEVLVLSEAGRTVPQPGPARDAFEKHLDSPMRVVLEVEPTMWLTCDAAQMMGESFKDLGV